MIVYAPETCLAFCWYIVLQPTAATFATDAFVLCVCMKFGVFCDWNLELDETASNHAQYSSRIKILAGVLFFSVLLGREKISTPDISKYKRHFTAGIVSSHQCCGTIQVKLYSNSQYCHISSLLPSFCLSWCLCWCFYQYSYIKLAALYWIDMIETFTGTDGGV